MTVPSEKTLLIGKCPNCGSTDWIERWVDAISGPPTEVSAEDYLEHRMRKSGSNRNIFFVCGDFIQKTRQFIMTCKRCGYTLVKDFYKEAEQQAMRQKMREADDAEKHKADKDALIGKAGKSHE